MPGSIACCSMAEVAPAAAPAAVQQRALSATAAAAPLQHGWPSCFLRLQQWPRQQLTPSGSQMLRKGRSGQYFGLPSSVQIEDSSSYSNLHLRAEIYEICTLSGALGLLGLFGPMGLWGSVRQCYSGHLFKYIP